MGEGAGLHHAWCGLARGCGCSIVLNDEHFKHNHRVEDLTTPRSYVCGCAYNGIEISNPYSILHPATDGDAKEKELSDCARMHVLRRKARDIVRLLAVDQGLKATGSLPKIIRCGELRTSVRSIYGLSIDPVHELSIKTAAKVETQPCDFCSEAEGNSKIEKWTNSRTLSSAYSSERLSEFGRAFAENVPNGWNKRKTPYIPNGAAALGATRREGGNWNRQIISDDVDVKLIYSSGKPRVVTLYSEGNVSVLTPLHHSLYSFLKGRNWLLVGSPTSERLRYLQSGCKGTTWLSFDYESATDNIKTVYVQRAVEILIEKAEGLSEDEERCLRIMSSLRLDGVDAASGQPMGSPMSFPLLCLINKTVVDLALSDLLLEGKISFKEWTSHRCLINGDDLLTRSTSSGDLASAIERCGKDVGLIVNRSKTMNHPEYAEINSTVFKNCVEEKKTNVSALWMAAEVCDPIAYAMESTKTPLGFKRVLENNATRLARQKIKTTKPIPCRLKSVAIYSPKIRKALASLPRSRAQKETNLFPVEVYPVDFTLTREEEGRVISAHVQQIRDDQSWRPLFAQKRRLRKARMATKVVHSNIPERSLWKLLTPERNHTEKTTLSCLARYWENKRKEELLATEAHEHPGLIVSDGTRINAMIDAIKYQRQVKTGDRQQPQPSHVDDPFSNGCGFVSLR